MWEQWDFQICISVPLKKLANKTAKHLKMLWNKYCEEWIISGQLLNERGVEKNFGVWGILRVTGIIFKGSSPNFACNIYRI